MKNDPAIQAVRDVRHQISAAVDHDPQKLLEYYRQRQERNQSRPVRKVTGERKPPDESAA